MSIFFLLCIGIGLIQTKVLIDFYAYLWFVPGPQNSFYLKYFADFAFPEYRKILLQSIADADRPKIIGGFCIIFLICFIVQVGLPIIEIVVLSFAKNAVKGAVSLTDILLICTIPTIYNMGISYSENIEYIRNDGKLFKKLIAAIVIAFSSAITILACLMGWLFIVYLGL